MKKKDNLSTIVDEFATQQRVNELRWLDSIKAISSALEHLIADQTFADHYGMSAIHPFADVYGTVLVFQKRLENRASG